MIWARLVWLDQENDQEAAYMLTYHEGDLKSSMSFPADH